MPYTLENETKLSKEYTDYFAFAKEKLVELKELSQIAESDDINAEDTLKANRQLLQVQETVTMQKLRKD